MPRLIDELAEQLRGVMGDLYDVDDVSFGRISVVNKVLRDYDAMRQQEVEEVQLTEENLVDECDERAFDYTALDSKYEDFIVNWAIPENFDEWGQGYGRCLACGMPWQVVRPGKGQPACECSITPVEDKHAEKE